jgi:hypothetical protein
VYHPEDPEDSEEGIPMLSVLIFGIQVELGNQGIYRLGLGSFVALLSDLVGYTSEMIYSFQIIITLLF